VKINHFLCQFKPKGTRSQVRPTNLFKLFKSLQPEQVKSSIRGDDDVHFPAICDFSLLLRRLGGGTWTHPNEAAELNTGHRN
jgi:hypothetical protein